MDNLDTTGATTRWWGLTGGIASGKSTALQFLTQLGLASVDADALSRQLTAPNGKAMQQVRECFGTDYIQADGAMDRAKMRNLVFQDLAAKHQLESILHPLIQEEAFLAASRHTHQLVIFDIPLLAESPHWRSRLDGILVIDCEPEIQLRRLLARNPLSEVEASRIIQQQARRDERLACADVCVYNGNTTIMQLEASLQAFCRFLAVS